MATGTLWNPCELGSQMDLRGVGCAHLASISHFTPCGTGARPHMTMNRRPRPRRQYRPRAAVMGQAVQVQVNDLAAQVHAANDVIREMARPVGELAPEGGALVPVGPPDDGIRFMEPRRDHQADVGQTPFDDHLVSGPVWKYKQHGTWMWCLSIIPMGYYLIMGLGALGVLCLCALLCLPCVIASLQSWLFLRLASSPIDDDTRKALELQRKEGGRVLPSPMEYMCLQLCSMLMRWTGGREVVECRHRARRVRYRYSPDERIFSQREIKPVEDDLIVDVYNTATVEGIEVQVSSPALCEAVLVRVYGETDEFVRKNASHMLIRYPQLCVPSWLHFELHRGNVARILFEHQVFSNLNARGGGILCGVQSATASLMAIGLLLWFGPIVQEFASTTISMSRLSGESCKWLLDLCWRAMRH